MRQQRSNTPDPQGPRRRGGESGATERIRRRVRAEPDVELSSEELRALADEGIDPEDLRRAANAPADQEASPHDRDTPRDHIESLVAEEEDY